MKFLLQLFLNFLILIQYFLECLFGLFWYGKLIKISPYHLYMPYSKSKKLKGCGDITSFNQKFNNEFFQEELFPKQKPLLTPIEFNEFLYQLYNNDKEIKMALDNTCPIYEDFSYNKIGNQTIIDLLISNYSKKYYLNNFQCKR